MLLQPAPVSTRQFAYNPHDQTFSAEASELPAFGRVYDDAVDIGLTLVSSHTGRGIVFVVTGGDRDREGDIRFWTLEPVDAPAGFRNLHMVVYND